MNFKKVISVLLVMFFLSGNFIIVRAQEEKSIDFMEIILDDDKTDENLTTKNIKILNNKILVEDLKNPGEIIYKISDDDKNNIQKIESIKIKFSHKLSTVAYKDDKENKYVLGISQGEAKHQVKYLPNREEYGGFRDGLFIKISNDWYQCKLENGEYVFNKLEEEAVKEFNKYKKYLKDYGVNILVSENGEEFKKLKTGISVTKKTSELSGDLEMLGATDSYIETLTANGISNNGISKNVKYIKIELNEKFEFKDVEENHTELLGEEAPISMMEVSDIDFDILKSEPKDEENNEDEKNIKKQSREEEENLRAEIRKAELQRRLDRLNEERRLGESRVVRTNAIKLGSSQNYVSSNRANLPKQVNKYYKLDEEKEKKYEKEIRDLRRRFNNGKNYYKDKYKYNKYNKYGYENDISKELKKYFSSDKNKKDNYRYYSSDKNKKDNYKYYSSDKKDLDEYLDSNSVSDDYDDNFDVDNNDSEFDKFRSRSSKFELGDEIKEDIEEDVDKDIQDSYTDKGEKRSKYKKINFDENKKDIIEFDSDSDSDGNEQDDYIDDSLTDDEFLENLDKNQSTQAWSENLDNSIEDVEEKQVRAEKTVSKVYLSGLFMTLTSILAYDKVGFLRKFLKF